jgi:hypothetical protein
VAAGQADVPAEFGVDDLDTAARSAKSGCGDLCPGGAEQSLALGIGDCAANHDPGWVECIDETDAGGRECSSTALQD